VHVPDEANADGLSDREAEILAWVARGKTNQELAALLLVSPHTVRKQVEHAHQKLRIHARTAAVARAFAPLNEYRQAAQAPPECRPGGPPLTRRRR
jgi:DNA-binding CsgD family transcriptional regulator